MTVSLFAGRMLSTESVALSGPEPCNPKFGQLLNAPRPCRLVQILLALSEVMKKTMRTLSGLLFLLMILSLTAESAEVVETDEHILTKIAEDVYTIRHKRAAQIGALSGNTTVIIGDRDVLVVDSCLLASIARSDIALIRKWTTKPVRYLVNTHWHGDHTWGNGQYEETFPGLTIIAHTETARQMQGYLPNFLERNVKGSEEIKRVLESGKTESGIPLTEEQRKQLQEDIPRAESRAQEYKTMVTRLPNLTFDQELTLNLGNREVQIKHLGRGNTAGDAILYLPHEKVVIAGDLLVYPSPFLIGGFPSEWSKTLQRIANLEPATIVPGHGAVLSGDDAKNYLNLIKDLLDVVSAAVRKETYRLGNASGNLEAVTLAVSKSPEVETLRQRFAGNDQGKRAEFDGRLPGLIQSAYREVWGN
jgi:glyoxylase-like metal-dependent hydrolase (beta-lactamase superfamily II)